MEDASVYQGIADNCINITSYYDDIVRLEISGDTKAYSCRLLNDNSNVIVFARDATQCKRYIESCMKDFGEVTWCKNVKLKDISARNVNFGKINGSIEVFMCRVNTTNFKAMA